MLISILLSLIFSQNALAAQPTLIQPANPAFPEYPKISADKDPLITPQEAAKPKSPIERRDYFRTLFDEVDTAKTTPTPVESVRLYDKLERNSVAYGVLKQYPNMQTGRVEFRVLKSKSLHHKEIKEGQSLIHREFGQDSRTYKQFTDQIDQKLYDPNSSLSNEDWFLMANAFRTLDAPGPSHKPNILGSLLAEYILLGGIKKYEMIPNPTQEDKSTLTDFYYALSQLYQVMYKNEEKLFNQPRDGQIPLSIDTTYFEGTDYGPYPVEYLIPFDYMVGNRLDLLESGLLLDPYDDLAWAQLIDFAAYDLVDPWFYDQLYPDFWYAYFPYGFRVQEANFLHRKWKEIRHHRDVRHDRHLRLNHRGGPAAVGRLHRIYANPASRLNQTITRIEKSGIHKPHSPKFKRVEREQAMHTHHRTQRSERIHARHEQIFNENQPKMRTHDRPNQHQSTHHRLDRTHVFTNQSSRHSERSRGDHEFRKRHQDSPVWKSPVHSSPRPAFVPQERHSFHTPRPTPRPSHIPSPSSPPTPRFSSPRSHDAVPPRLQSESHSHNRSQGDSRGDGQGPKHKKR